MTAAVRSLSEFGYAETSTDIRVAEMAKVARGSLLHQFPTRVELILAVAEYARSEGAGRIHPHRAGEEGAEGASAIWPPSMASSLGGFPAPGVAGADGDSASAIRHER